MNVLRESDLQEMDHSPDTEPNDHSHSVNYGRFSNSSKGKECKEDFQDIKLSFRDKDGRRSSVGPPGAIAELPK